MRLTYVAANRQFDPSRLVFDGFSAPRQRRPLTTGSGTINFSAENRGLDIALQADFAQLIARDDLGATVTGPLRIRSDGNGGTISGKVRLERSAYVLGQSAAVAAVPRLKIREINGGNGLSGAAVVVPARPWMLDVEADVPGAAGCLRAGAGQRMARHALGAGLALCPGDHRGRPSWCAAAMNLPVAGSSCNAASSASGEKARPTRFSTSWRRATRRG